MILRLIFTFIAITLSSGCSLLGHSDDAPTIASLGNKPVKLKELPVSSNDYTTMSAYRDYLDTGDDSESRPIAMRRLADINLVADELPQAGQTEQVTLTSQQAADAVRLYEDVLRIYPDRADNDLVLYQLGRAYEQNGQQKASMKILSLLINQHPHSQYVEEAHFRRAEMQFIQKQWQSAEQDYQAVISTGADSHFYQQSLYKLGWSFFKQSLFEEGLDAFFVLLDKNLSMADNGKIDMAKLSRAEQEMVNDTLRAVSLSFSYEAGAKTLSSYMEKHGVRAYESEIYLNLGSMYLQKERYSDAAETFQGFVKANPAHVHSPDFQMRIIKTYQKGKFPTLAMAAKKDYVNLYKPGSTYWSQHDIEKSQAVIEYLKITARELAQHHHSLAQKKHKANDFKQAAYWYRTWLDAFGSSNNAAEINFLLAEVLAESGDSQSAAAEYIKTAYDYDHHPKAAEAAYASVLGYQQHENKLIGDIKIAWHRSSIDNALRFADSFAEHPQSVAVRLKSAENLLTLNELEAAAINASRVLAADVITDKQQLVAWTVLGHARFDLGDYLAAEQAYQSAGRLSINGSKTNIQLVERLAASIYKQGEHAATEGDTPTSVNHYLRIRKLTPTASIVATAEFDAAAGLMSIQEWDQATKVLVRFKQNYPKDTRMAEVSRRLATAYLAQASPLEAAAEFERIAKHNPDKMIRQEAMLQSAELYSEAEKPGKAVIVYIEYIKLFPKPLETAIEARHYIGNHYVKMNDVKQARYWQQEIIRADTRGGSDRTDRTRFLAANAVLLLADNTYRKFTDIRLTLPLKRSLARKKDAMQAALKQYEQAAGYEIASITTAATFRIADVYYQFSKSMLESERPRKLTGDALAQYDILLEEQAFPFEEKAIELHEVNISRISNGVYDPWIEKSLLQLGSLMPARYAKTERSVMYVESIR